MVFVDCLVNLFGFQVIGYWCDVEVLFVLDVVGLLFVVSVVIVFIVLFVNEICVIFVVLIWLFVICCNFVLSVVGGIGGFFIVLCEVLVNQIFMGLLFELGIGVIVVLVVG